MQRVTSPYEILIRMSRTGIVGAQYQTLSEIVDDDGAVLSASEGPVTPLLLAPGDGLDLPEVLGEATAVALIENNLLKLDVQQLQAQVASLQSQLAALAPQT